MIMPAQRLVNCDMVVAGVVSTCMLTLYVLR